jgi:hypothetical protein
VSRRARWVSSRTLETGASRTQLAVISGAVIPAQLRSNWTSVSTFFPNKFVQTIDIAVDGTTPVDADSDGLATVIGVSATVITAIASSVGAAVATAISGATSNSDFDSDGTATVNIVGGVAATTVAADGTSNGVAIVDGRGGAAQGCVGSTNGVGNVNAISGVLAKSVYGSDGQANVFGNGVDSAAVISAGFPYTVILRRRRRGAVNA